MGEVGVRGGEKGGGRGGGHRLTGLQIYQRLSRQCIKHFERKLETIAKCHGAGGVEGRGGYLRRGCYWSVGEGRGGGVYLRRGVSECGRVCLCLCVLSSGQKVNVTLRKTENSVRTVTRSTRINEINTCQNQKPKTCR